MIELNQCFQIKLLVGRDRMVQPLSWRRGDRTFATDSEADSSRSNRRLPRLPTGLAQSDCLHGDRDGSAPSSIGFDELLSTSNLPGGPAWPSRRAKEKSELRGRGRGSRRAENDNFSSSISPPAAVTKATTLFCTAMLLFLIFLSLVTPSLSSVNSYQNSIQHNNKNSGQCK